MIVMKVCYDFYCNDDSREVKFCKFLCFFFGFNFFIFMLMIFGMGGIGLWKISVIWGVFLVICGYCFFGKEDDYNYQCEEDFSCE